VRIRWRSVLKVGIPVLVLIWLFGTNNPGLVLALGLVVAGTVFYLWRRDRSEMRSVLGELGPPPGKASAWKRVVCLLSGHSWMPAAEALDPGSAGAGPVASYAGDGDDTVVLVCRRCGRKKAVGVADFRRFTGGVSGYGSHIDP
jgi:hypothetical protein